MKEVPMPSDILWENRMVTQQTRWRKDKIVKFIIFLMLMVSASIIFKITKVSKEFLTKYPVVDCQPIHDQYKQNHSEFEKVAVMEYLHNKELTKKNIFHDFNGSV